MPHQAATPDSPYKHTPVPASRSREQIEFLLQKHGAIGANWTTLFEKGRTELTFGVRGADSRQTLVRVIVPAFVNEHRSWDPESGKSRVVKAENWAQSMRLLYYYLKSKLEAVRVGLREFEEEFLADTLVKNERGETVRVVDLMKPMLEGGQIRRVELPSGEETETRGKPRAPVDAEYRAVP